ncbi:hypothetical protein FW778_12025 [Ginsengibacter hankyongi]|uniref:Uncharacterized protein n=1 Tax=Ginsengibacter hankyongi TaxID=2607284 RepID=A0A5J5IH68_9BACT|nr:hypothetical protein [Ginsengibacter hankyongi]KAA9039535.1 hypothetical protein FW778_12025 [Ginsengibacter hankyongi]
MKRKLPSLKVCVLLDIIGCLSYVMLPFGPIWAVLSGIIFYVLFGRKFGMLGGIFSSLEELFPGIDLIPTFTLAWLIRKYEIEQLRLKQYP